MSDGDWENKILHVIERWWSSRYSEKHGLVSSYDPKNHMAKVTFQPGGQESDWLPIETGHIGNGFGIAIGLTPGDGKKTGDQVIVRYQGNDIESGKVVQRVHSSMDKPPEVQAGEMVFWSKFTKSPGQSGLGDDSQSTGSGDQIGETGGQQGSGQQFYFKNDGSLTLTDGAGATIVQDGKGNIVHTCNDYTQNINGNHTQNVGGSKTTTISGDDTVSISGDKNVTISKSRNDNVTKSWSSLALPSSWPWLMDDDG